MVISPQNVGEWPKADIQADQTQSYAADRRTLDC
jgi:hypothetical protein